MRALLPVTIVLGTFAALVLAGHAKASPIAEPPPPPPAGPAAPPLLPTVPGGLPPANIDILHAELGALLAQVRTAPGTVDPHALDALALELRHAGLTSEAEIVESASLSLPRAAPGGPAAGPFPATLPVDMQNQSVFFLTDDRSDPTAIRALVARIRAMFPGGKASADEGGAAQADAGRTAVVLNNVNLRPSPTSIATTIVQPNDAVAGATVRVLVTGIASTDPASKEWWRIVTPSGAEGFVSAVGPAGEPNLRLT